MHRSFISPRRAGARSVKAGRRALSLLGLAALVTACQSVPTTRGTAPALAPVAPLDTAGAEHYAVRPELSDIRFLVYKAGPLAAFGHDHVIQATQASGDVYLQGDFTRSGFNLTLPVVGFTVDAPEARAVEGADFAKQPSDQAVADTRKNMLGPKELDAEHYPEITLRSVSLVGPDWQPDLTLRLTLHGVERELQLPVTLERGAGRLTVSGSFEVRQSDYGISPLSILGGGLSVVDTVRVRFRIVAMKE